VSIGEVRRALEVGFRPDQILFSGVGKTRRELDEATGLGIFQINVESEHELEKILSLNRPARIGFRWTPGLDVKTHPFIKTSHDDTKFGLSESDVRRLVQRIHHHPKVHLKGISLHLGSQIMEMNDFRMAFLALKELLLSLPCQVENVDLGGGLGIDYRHQNLEDDEKRLEAYQKVVHEIWDKTPWTLLFEPGRFLVARAGGILTQVQAVKNTRTKKIVVVDAGMTHLIRPVLYDAFHGVFPLIQRSGPFETVDIVGPICESSDFLALDRSLPVIENGDFLWIADVGAYGSSMASGYNLRPEAEQTFIEDL